MTQPSFCTRCGNVIDPSASFCGSCGAAVRSNAPNDNRASSDTPLFTRKQASTPPSRRRGLKVGMLVVALAILVICVLGTLSNSGSGSAGDRAENSKASDSVQVPLSEAALISVVSDAQAKSKNVENDMQRGGVKANRDRSLCAELPSLGVSDWVGTVKTIDSNSDGKGVLAVSLAPDITVKTGNNGLSDIGSNTLIEPGTQLFASASAMKTGDLVKFSGTFLPGAEGDCLQESSLTLEGKVESPDFIFRFSGISPYATAQTSEDRPQNAQQNQNPAEPSDEGGAGQNEQPDQVAESSSQAQPAQSSAVSSPADIGSAAQPVSADSTAPQLTTSSSTTEQVKPVTNPEGGAQSDLASSGQPSAPPLTIGDASPQTISGAFTGVVRNQSAHLSAIFDVHMQQTAAALGGCMSVHLPLAGSGPLNGSVEGNNVSFVVVSQVGKITFVGRSSAQGYISGTYTVLRADGSQEHGLFSLQKQGSASGDSGCPF